MSFSSWLDLTTAAAESSPSESILTRKGWNMLWETREHSALVHSCVRKAEELASSAFQDESLSGLAAEFRPVINSLRGKKISVDLTANPGLEMTRRASRSDVVNVRVDEGLVRFLHTLMSLAVYSLLPTDTPGLAGGFITGAESHHYDDAERIQRTMAAYCGVIYNTGANFLPVVIVHTKASRIMADTLTIGALTFGILHEVAHTVVDDDICQNRGSKLATLLEDRQGYRELYCDTTAALLCPLAVRHLGGDLASVALSGVAIFPELADLLGDLRFVIAPGTHPSSVDRSNAVEGTLRRVLRKEIVDDAYLLLRESVPFSVLQPTLSQLASLKWIPRSKNHLANVLRATGPIQFLSPDPTSPKLGEDRFFLCSRAIASAEEALRRRTLSAFSHLAGVGHALSDGIAPQDVLNPKLCERALTSFYRRHPKAKAERTYELEVHLLWAIAGQHYFWTKFIADVVGPLAKDMEALDRHGVTYDTLASRCSGLKADVVTECVAVLERSRRGEEVGFQIDEAVAGELTRALLESVEQIPDPEVDR